MRVSTATESVLWQEREEDMKHELRKQGVDVPCNNPAEHAARSKREGGIEGLDPSTRRHLEGMWRRQARQPLAKRLSAADMLRDEGNDKYSEGDFEKA